MINLAIKYRPKKLEEIVGQSHLLSPDAVLYQLIISNNISHTFFYGPAGCGKTSLARIIASILNCPFYELNATTIKVEELRKIFKTYHNALQKPLIFIDEVHRLSTNQQEVLLPFMENNSCIIIGASTQNPFFSLTSAIRSRSHLFELQYISNNELRSFLNRVITLESIDIEKDAKEYLISSSGGDARAMLNLLDSANSLNQIITLNILKQIRPHANQGGSIESQTHYELTSAMIKSIRGSDVDASIYYLAQLIEGGEPPLFIARRLAILASEDIGNANPPALNLASSALNIVKHIGYPEARITLSQLVIYLASSPKSNSAYMAINSALSDIKNGFTSPVPSNIKPNSKEYLYPHDFNGWVEQEYMTTPKKYYHSKGMGFEKRLLEWIGKIRGINS
ncbi:MAG: replication-associated recombination protein A [Sulfurovum sp.]